MTIDEMSGADFSEDGMYRRLLWRIWDVSLPLMLMIMLNPSKAGRRESDPTVTRQIERGKRNGFGGLLVANAFDVVATYVGDMRRHRAPLSPSNNQSILDAAARAERSGGMVIAAWGPHAKHLDRHAQMLDLLVGIKLHALVTTKDGYPGHPLYVSYEAQPFLYPSSESGRLSSASLQTMPVSR